MGSSKSLASFFLALVLNFAPVVVVEGVAWTNENGPWNVNLNPDPSDPAAYYGTYTTNLNVPI
ncbi:hypothetical protein HMI54_012294 [Coelomomyces lativittatus]|nr:hypothetical protein HMI54_012294 [Coelomomyces lativittatus]